MDMNTIKKIFIINAKAYIIPLLTIFLITFLIFFAGTFAIMTVAKPHTYVNVAALCAGIVFLTASFIYGMATFTRGYYNAVKCGISRRNYLAGTLLYHIAVSMCFLLLILIAQTEVYINNHLYASFASLEAEHMLPSVFIMPLLYIAAPLIITVASIIMGAVSLKFGAYVLGITYTISLLFFTTISDYLKDATSFFNNAIPIDQLSIIIIIIALILIAAALTASIKFYLKADFK